MLPESTGQARDAPSDPWDGLMQAALRGDQVRYAQLLREMSAWLRGYYARRLPPGVVEDAAQDALIAVHEKRQTYQPGKPVRPWVAAIARYKWIDRLRTMREHVELQEDQFSTDGRDHALDAAMVLQTLLAKLKPAQAEAIRLVKLHGYSVAEASRMTGQSESLVKVNIHRGIARLAREIERQEDPAGNDEAPV